MRAAFLGRGVFKGTLLALVTALLPLDFCDCPLGLRKGAQHTLKFVPAQLP
jgi:hypothetical protein